MVKKKDMIEEIINGGAASYISELPEFKNGFPKGVINKTSADVGGTYWAINCDVPYIVVVPTLDLLSSICNDANNIKEVLRVDGDTKQDHYKNNDKIAVTYDSFKKLTTWIKDFSKYKVLIDEYHLLLESVDYREDAISELFSCVEKFECYTFITATPNSPKFEISQLRSLPHYKINWSNLNKIIPIRIKCARWQQSLMKIISVFKNKALKVPDINGNDTLVKELYIYINSVNSIKQIIDTMELDYDEIKVCCSDRKRNRELLRGIPISNVTDDNKPINFFTSKCFQGCNLFTENGLVIVVSDANKKSMVTDLSSDLVQIAGRIRKSSNNCFAHTMIHIFTTNSDIMTDEEFESIMSEKRYEANIMISEQHNLSEDARRVFLSKMNCSNDIVNIVDNCINYSELKEKFFYYKHEMRKQYIDGVTVRGSYNDKFVVNKQYYWNDFIKGISKVSSLNFKEALISYYKDFDKNYEIIYPEFKDYKKHLTIAEVNSYKYKKEKLDLVVAGKMQLRSIFNNIKPGFISKAYLKEWIRKEFEKRNIILTPKASLIESYREVKETKEKGVNGYIIY